VTLLDRLLDGLDVAVEPFAICEVGKGASLVLEDHDATSIHYVLRGEGVARQMAGSEISLTPRTVVIAPPGACLVVTCGRTRHMTLPAPVCRELPGGWQRMTFGDGPAGLVLTCGGVRATHRRAVGLFDHLRTPLVHDISGDAEFRDPLHRLLDELAAPRPGTRTMAEILMKECLVVLLRRYSQGGDCRVPWLVALDHPRLGAAISAMLDRPEAGHTLQSLAETAGMSRAAFARRFKEAFGRTVMDFLKEIRLRHAARLLRATDLPVKAVASRSGFESRSYFSRAFKAFSGVDPAGFRVAATAVSSDPASGGEKTRLS